jgi:hypothetical protein
MAEIVAVMIKPTMAPNSALLTDARKIARAPHCER